MKLFFPRPNENMGTESLSNESIWMLTISSILVGVLIACLLAIIWYSCMFCGEEEERITYSGTQTVHPKSLYSVKNQYPKKSVQTNITLNIKNNTTCNPLELSYNKEILV